VKTPRTDAERRALKKAKSYPVDPVSAEFARQLERKLAAMTALADRLAQALRESRNTHLDTIERCPTIVREAITAYEAHKQKHHE
jgi:hypothetical protein